MLDYSPFFETIKKKGFTTYSLIEKYQVNRRTLHNLKHNLNMTLLTIENLCNILDCEIQDIVKFSKD